MPSNNKKVFRFSVNKSGKFTYRPNSDWGYLHKDSIRFVSSTGPFSIAFRRTDVVTASGENPLGGGLEARKEGDTWVAEIRRINDGMTDEQRRKIWQEKGFIAKWRYLIGAFKDGKVRMDDTHNGTYHC